jgi:signal peptidase I
VAVPGSGLLVLRRIRAGVTWILFTLAFYAVIITFRAFTHFELYPLISLAGIINSCTAAWICAFHGRRFGRAPRWIVFIPVVLVSILWVSIINVQIAAASGVKTFSVPSRGMTPFIRPGDSVVVDMRYYEKHPLAQGHVIVVYRVMLHPLGGVLSVKRVIGVAGDRIQIAHGAVIRNGVRLEEPYARHDAGPAVESWLRDTEPVLVPPSQLFLLGDNRDDSLDSRSPDVGFYDESQVRGKVIGVFHPFWVNDSGTDF